jgi:hypothetical protein
VLFGETGNDDLIGGYGHDWISGGAGQDGILGDDGRIFTSRNGTPEPLYGLEATTPDSIGTPGGVQQADIHALGQLKKSVDLTPFNPDLGGDELLDPEDADDILYGGLGSDWLHGGAGDDAISGAEALPGFYADPADEGDILKYNSTTGTFEAYDEFYPRLRIDGFLLNFDATQSDGDDRLFGDLGNDWLVGGTGRDHLYGGWGDDLLNADDDHDTNGGANDVPDADPSYADLAFGGAGRATG